MWTLRNPNGGSYVEHYGSPTELFEFASAWLVGPRTAQSYRVLLRRDGMG